MKLNDILNSKDKAFAAPQVACKLNQLLKTSPYNEEVVEVVRYDPALTAQILHVCNTVVFQRGQNVSSLEDAVGRLGFKNILRIVWQISIGNMMQNPLKAYGMEAGALWQHSISTAIAAEELSKLTTVLKDDASTAFTAGLLHDFGKIMINQVAQTKPNSIYDYSTAENLSILETESALYGMNHAEFGSKLLERWQQSDCLIAAVAHHHAPASAPNAPLAAVVHLADMCTHSLGLSYGWRTMSIPLATEALTILKVDSSHLDRTMIAVRERIEEVELFMSVL